MTSWEDAVGYSDELSELATLPDETVGACSVAKVERVDGEQVVLSIGADRFCGRRAFSCLVVPRAGDLVSVIGDHHGGRYVTAILERQSPGEVELFSDRAIAIRSSAGVRVTAATALDLEAAGRMCLRSPLLETVAGRFVAFAKAVCVTSGEAVLQSKLARVFSELLDVAAQRIGVHAEHSHRQIDGTEQVRCRHYDLKATEVAQVRAQAALVKAKDLVKMDAKQIQIG
jgi:hypothetical protein